MLGVIALDERTWRMRYDQSVRDSVKPDDQVEHLDAWRRGLDLNIAATKEHLRELVAQRRRAMRASIKGERHEGDAERMGNLPPTSERAQHSTIQSPDKQIADAEGNIGAPYRGFTLLDDWARAGKLQPGMLEAGNEFHRLFYRAHLEPLKAADMSRVGGAGGPMEHFGDPRARRELHAALDALGGLESMLGSCAWSVLGEDRSIRHWAMIYGRATLNEHVAKGVVLGVLGSLKVHFGY